MPQVITAYLGRTPRMSRLARPWTRCRPGTASRRCLRSVSLHVDTGEVVAVVGANGVGKSTLLRTITGLLHPTHGDIQFDGVPIAGMPAHAIVGHGLAMVPEGGRLFMFMTVLENLELGAFGPPRAGRRSTQPRRGDGAVSDPASAAHATRRLAVGRRTPDVRDRARADEPAAHADAGRAFARPVAGDAGKGIRPASARSLRRAISPCC